MSLQIGTTVAQARRAKNLTQEALADLLGVSAAAVSKWETNASYPDITLLSPLARALGLTVDALLGFRAAPTDEELKKITAHLREIFDGQGFAAGRDALEEVLREYPTSGALKLVAGGLYYHYLASALLQADDTEQTAEEISARCLQLFEQGERECTDVREKLSAQMLSINTLTMLGRYEEAEQLIEALPAKQVVDPDVLRLNLYLAQGELDKAEQLARRSLLSRVIDVSGALMSLSTVARRQHRFEEAAALINAYTAVDTLFGLDRSNGEMLRLMLALDQGDTAAALDALDRYIDARLAYTLDYRDNPFFAGVQTAVPSPREIAAAQRLTLRSLEEDESYAALRSEPRFQAALDRLRAAIPPDA